MNQAPPTFHRVVRLFAAVRRSLDAVHRMASRLADRSEECRDIAAGVAGVRAVLASQDWVLDLPLEDEHWDRVLGPRPAQADLAQDDLAPDDLARVESGLEAMREWLVRLSQALQNRHAHAHPPARPSNHSRGQERQIFPPAASPVGKSRNAAALGFAAFSNATSVPETGPLRVIMSVADQCNYRCRTCYQSLHQDFAYYDISSSDLARIADWFRFASSVTVGGFGEPLLSPAAAHVLAAAKAAGAATTVVTNGSLLERLTGLPPLDRIEISLDGASKQVLETVRSGARLDTIVAGLRGLAPEQRANVVFNVVVNKLNVAEITDIVALARREGLREVCLQTFDGYLPWHDDMRLTAEDLIELDEQVAQARLVGGAPVSAREAGASSIKVRDLVARRADARATPVPPAEVLGTLARLPNPRLTQARGRNGLAGEVQALLDQLAPDLPPFLAALAAAHGPVTAYFAMRGASPDLPAAAPYCMEPFSTIVIKSDGTTNPCCKLDWNMGNINDHTVEAIWNGPAYRTLRASLISRRDMPSVCVSCRDANRSATLPALLDSMLALGAPLPRALVPPDVHLPPEIEKLPPVRKLMAQRRRPKDAPQPLKRGPREAARQLAAEPEEYDAGVLECRLGTVRLFSTADLRTLGMGLGWADPEEGHTWNDGIDTEYSIAIASPPAVLTLEIIGTPFIVAARPRQELSVFGNGQLAGTHVMSAGMDHRLSFTLQPHWWMRNGRRWTMNLLFHLPHSVRPCDIDLSDDRRELGFAFRSICLREYDPALAELADAIGP